MLSVTLEKVSVIDEIDTVAMVTPELTMLVGLVVVFDNVPSIVEEEPEPLWKNFHCVKDGQVLTVITEPLFLQQ